MILAEYQTLANELKDVLARYRPPEPVRRVMSPQERRRRRLASKRACMARARARAANNGVYNPKVRQAKQFFPLLGEALGCSATAAKERFYRHKVPAEIVEQTKSRMK